MNCIMTALQLNAEMYRELSVIAEDESLMRKALKAIKRITAKKRMVDETDYIMSSPAMVKILNDGDKEIEEGKFEPISLDNLWK